MQGSVFVGVSLDGQIARADGGLDWLPHDTAEDHGFDAFMATVDALVMGRSTYDIVRGFPGWAYGEKPVYVLTHRELPPPPAGATAIGWAGGGGAAAVRPGVICSSCPTWRAFCTSTAGASAVTLTDSEIAPTLNVKFCSAAERASSFTSADADWNPSSVAVSR